MACCYGCSFGDTKLGKELLRVMPPETRRVIIDIPCDDIVRVFYECNADKAILELDWENALSGAEVISATQKVKG